jgi:hypothetical protein
MMRKFRGQGIAVAFLAALIINQPGQLARAADQADSPNVAGDQAADIGDVYFFLDPNDNTKAVMIMTVRSFIVPGENVNMGIFDPNVAYLFRIDKTFDSKPDIGFLVTFDQRSADPGPSGKENLQVLRAQTANVQLPNGHSFNAPVVNPSLGPTAPDQATGTRLDAANTGVDFFAGEVDDPFFFDLPAFENYIASIRNGSPNPSVFSRARDTFAGYNTLAIALRVPLSMIQGSGNIIGLDVATARPTQVWKPTGRIKTTGNFVVLDRAANPAINSTLIPFTRRNEYNAGTTQQDGSNKFAADITETLQELGTNQTNIDAIKAIAVNKGDFLRLDVTKPNTGGGGGTNVGSGWPNGRRLQDDVMDAFLTLINNGTPLGDNVNANDVSFGGTFPFLAPSQQPRYTNTTDDGTRN